MAIPFRFEALRRFPDVEADNLFAVDATDRLILDRAAAHLADAPAASVTVIGDRYGALTLGAAGLYGATGIRTHQDPLLGERALARNAHVVGLDGAFTNHGLDEGLLAGAQTVLLQLPRELAALDEMAETIAEFASPEVQVFAGGRVKHMTLAQTRLLRERFGHVDVGLAEQKSRVLHAAEPIRGGEHAGYPRREYHRDIGVWVCAHGGAFGGTGVDIGTRFLLGFTDQMPVGAITALDLGCGTGVLAAALAQSNPAMRVIAADQSAAAVLSAAQTAQANGVDDRVRVVRDDVAESIATASVDLVVCNPPFHVGATVHTGLAQRMFGAAARVLRPGGQLWTVYNSHLGYRSALGRTVGPTREAGRNRKFTVTVSTVKR